MITKNNVLLEKIVPRSLWAIYICLQAKNLNPVGCFSGNNSQLELVLNEVRRLEEAALLNDEELRQMSLEQQQLMGAHESNEDVEIRIEISQLKQRLAGTDQELQRTNHTLRYGEQSRFVF